MKHIILFFCTVVVLFGCQNAQNQTESQSLLHTVGPVEFSKALKASEDHYLIDVRTPGEVAQGTLENAVNIDFNADDFEEKIAKLDKNKTCFVFCAMGGRSASAAEMMKNAGFKEIYDMRGGYTKWKKSGF